ncbi:uncharacterized protein LOC122298876 [Carya illinoinensis]|uniref:uncharacterized protein LOC122298876 n=1 Tax=Carya illinoinensis TaxID=32201 RepID=UPI001C7212ED|nr:uncharacterized protein LOC122298876 [Carya illinoinensis]
MNDFNDFIDTCGLVDMKAVGSKFSWCNGQRGLAWSWSKLDRCLMNVVAASFFSDALCKYMARTTSDYAPLSFVFKNMGNRYGPSPFKFKQMWVSHSNFWEVVNDTWSTSIDTRGLQGLATKLKKVKVVLKDWNRRVFGHTEMKIQEFENKIEQLDSQLQEGFSVDTEQALLEAKEELAVWMKREETRLSQQVKLRWMETGEASAQFFKTFVSLNKPFVQEMRCPDGTCLNSPEEIHSGAVDYFSSFLQARNPRDLPDLSNLVQHSILEEENANLLQLPSIQEVKEAMFSIYVDSSPGPDGFGSGFYKRPTGFDKFRPISLCSVVYKVFSKILVRRLSPILNRIISSEQGAFLPGRSIFENISLAQEMIHMINKKFDQKLCIDSLVLGGMNGSAKGFFSSGRGLRQGDPLSPYLFILVEEKRRSLLLTSFSEGFFPVKYLGVLLMVGRMKISYFDDLLCGIRRKLEGWQNRFLSSGTRLLLLRHVLASIPIHLLSVLHAPKAVMVVLKRLMSNFFWGSWNGKQKRHWVSWSKICSPIREGGLGLRKLEEVQESLFMKLAWNVLTGDSLWANFFKHKYVKNQHVTLVDQRKGTLFWKQIVGMFPKVLGNSWWRVRDGDVSFWRDPWLKSGALANSCDISNFPLLKVRECRFQNGWDVDLLHRLVGATKMEEILNCLGEQKEGGDLLIWKPTLNGVFSSKSAWDCVRVRAPKSEWAAWIWHSALPKKYSVTIWKALHYSLTVDSRISSWGIPLVSRCECCTQGCVEDQDHVLVYGRIAADIWRWVSLQLGMPYDSQRSWRATMELWFRHATHSTQKGALLALIPIIVTWSLWVWRCKARMEVKHVKRKNFLLVKWMKPSPGWFKLNVDGSSLGNPGHMGAGGVIRDAKGNLIWAFAKELGYGLNNEAELSALYYGLLFCKDLDIGRVEIELDSLLVVHWLQKGRCGIWYLEDYWEKIQVMVETLEVKIQHVYREGNAGADFLARLASNQKNGMNFFSLEEALCLCHHEQCEVASVFLTCTTTQQEDGFPWWMPFHLSNAFPSQQFLHSSTAPRKMESRYLLLPSRACKSGGFGNLKLGGKLTKSQVSLSSRASISALMAMHHSGEFLASWFCKNGWDLSETDADLISLQMSISGSPIFVGENILIENHIS